MVKYPKLPVQYVRLNLLQSNLGISILQQFMRRKSHISAHIVVLKWLRQKSWRALHSTSIMPNILLVEDEEHLAIGIRYNLTSEGLTVTTAADGHAALAILNEPNADVDLVVLDVMLPGMSGYAVCEEIRSQGSHIPVVMLTARTLVEDRIRGFNAGADVYLQKPFDLDELLSVIRSLLSRRKNLNFDFNPFFIRTQCVTVAPITHIENGNKRFLYIHIAYLNFFVLRMLGQKKDINFSKKFKPKIFIFDIFQKFLQK